MQKYTMADVAHICGVSKATVSRVINGKTAGVGDETRKRVLHTLEQLNYRPNRFAQSVATSKSMLIGMILPDVSNLFYPALMRGVVDALDQHHYSLIICDSDYSVAKERELLLKLVDQRVEGIILASGLSNEVFLREFRKYGIPLAIIGRTFDTHLSDTSISGDNIRGAEIAVSQLISSGNRRILYLDGIEGASGSQQRRKGYMFALQEHGIDPDPDLMETGEFSIQFGMIATANALDAGRDFTAVMTGSDLIAIGVLKELRRRGIAVPKEIEVIGFDGIVVSEIFEPEISTVTRPHYDMAYQAASNLIRIINGTMNEIRHVTVEPSLLLRETTK